ncbi:MAG: ethylbenzene dehydrogenase-related protein [Rhodothermales bacterium]
MKNRFFAITAFLALAFFVLQGCDRDGTLDALDDEEPDPVNLMTAPRVTTPPTIDGMADDAAWDQAAPVFISTSVVDIPAFVGYGGRRYQVQMKAVYDDDNIYFLARYNDATMDTDREPWYVDPVTGTWQQESRYPQFDENGTKIRKGYYEDKFSLMWEASPVEGFAQSGCAVSCHAGLNPFENDKGKTALKYTNNYGETLDMWHLKFVRSGGSSIPYMDDQHTNWTSTAGNGGRHSDPGRSHYASNKQTINGRSVPLYILKDATATYYWITEMQIAGGEAVKVVDVEASGDLVLADGSRVLASNPDFQRNGKLCPPSIYARTPDGDRADINAVARYSGGFWTAEIKRARITGSDVDVQFDDLTKDYPFGAAVFDNAGIAHASSVEPFFLRFK